MALIVALLAVACPASAEWQWFAPKHAGVVTSASVITQYELAQTLYPTDANTVVDSLYCAVYGSNFVVSGVTVKSGSATAGDKDTLIAAPGAFTGTLYMSCAEYQPQQYNATYHPNDRTGQVTAINASADTAIITNNLTIGMDRQALPAATNIPVAFYGATLSGLNTAWGMRYDTTESVPYADSETDAGSPEDEPLMVGHVRFAVSRDFDSCTVTRPIAFVRFWAKGESGSDAQGEAASIRPYYNHAPQAEGDSLKHGYVLPGGGAWYPWDIRLAPDGGLWTAAKINALQWGVFMEGIGADLGDVDVTCFKQRLEVYVEPAP